MRLRRPLVIAALVLVLVSAFSLAVLAGHAWDALAFVLPRPDDVPASQTWGIGYDGQQSYAIALDPMGRSGALDYPAYRSMRIVYPLAARLLALGNSDWIPWSMLGVNLLAAAATAGLLASLLQSRGARVEAAFVLFLSFNYLISIRLDLTEPLALALAVAGVRLAERGRTAAGVVFFGLAGLTKEVALAFPLALAIAFAWDKHWKEAAALAAGPPGMYLAWAWLVAIWFGASPFAEPRVPPTFPPFSGLLSLEGLESRTLVVLWCVGPALVAGIAALWQIVRSPSGGAAREAWMVLVWAGIISTLPTLAWVDPIAVLRVGAGLMVAIILWFGAARPRWLGFAFGLWAPSLLLFFLVPGLVR